MLNASSFLKCSVLSAQCSDFRFVRVSPLSRSNAVRAVIFKRRGAEWGERIAEGCREISAPIGAVKNSPPRNSQFFSAPLRFPTCRVIASGIVPTEN
jgi:hypothetical protein